MTDQHHLELPAAKRRRLIIRAVLRGLVVTTVLVVLYYLLPLDQPWDTDTAVRLLADLVLLGAGARVLLGAVRRGQQRRTGTGDGPATK